MASGIVAYSSPFVPAEWIAAHRLTPLRLTPGPSVVAAGAGICPFAHDFLQASQVPGVADGVIFTTTCDQMRRFAEQARASLPTFLMNVPATWQTTEAVGLYVAELRRMSEFLITLGGHAPTAEELRQTMEAFDKIRRNGSFESRAQWEKDRGGAAGDTLPMNLASSEKGFIRIALVGGPLRKQDAWIAEHLQHAGATIVLDATETGERTLPAPFDEARVRTDPLAELARAYFLTIPDAFRRPDSLLHDYLSREVQARRIRGILLIRCVWCDQWHAQVARIKDSLGVPVVEIDLGQDDHDTPRIKTRIDSLLDMVR